MRSFSKYNLSQVSLSPANIVGVCASNWLINLCYYRKHLEYYIIL